MTEQGIHVDDFEDEDPSVLDRHYGVHGRVRPARAGETGAGYTEEDEFDDDDGTLELDPQIAEENAANMAHEPVNVPENVDPFPSDDHREAFWTVLTQVREDEMIPQGFGLLPEEQEDGIYPSYEIITVGRRRAEYTVELPNELWWARSVLWSQALDILFRLEHI